MHCTAQRARVLVGNSAGITSKVILVEEQVVHENQRYRGYEIFITYKAPIQLYSQNFQYHIE